MELPSGKVMVGTQVSTGATDQRVCIRVQGRATYLHGPPLRDFAKEMIRRGHRTFELDLGKCSYMDSTFLGALVGVSLLLTESRSPPMSICRIGPRHLDSFKTLGIDRFFLLDGSDPSGAWSAQLHPLGASQSRSDLEGTVLEAHELLVEVDERNAPKFKDVLEYLREDVAKHRSVLADFAPETAASRWRQ